MIYTTSKPCFPKEEIEPILKKVKEVLENKEMLTMGQNVVEFERLFSKYIKSKYAIGTNSCTSALETTLRTLGVDNQEVIVPTQTFIATGSSVVISGGKVVFADINSDYNISLKSIKEKLSDKTKAIIVVHFAGLISEEIFDIKDLCNEQNIYLIEDCAHAHGASIDGIKAGNLGDVGCFSFFATKIMTTGEGGMIVTNNKELSDKMASIRNRGIDLNSPTEVFSNVGSNFRMSEISSILGLSQLKHLDEFVRHRNRIAAIYNDCFEDSNLVETIKYPDNILHSYWRYVMKLDSSLSREKLRELLLKSDIIIDWPYAPPLHLQPVFKKLYNTKLGMLPFAEHEMKKHFCLPMNLEINEKSAEYISSIVSKSLSKMA